MDYYQTPPYKVPSMGVSRVSKKLLLDQFALFIPKYRRSSLKTHNRIKTTSSPTFFLVIRFKSIYFFNIPKRKSHTFTQNKGCFSCGPFNSFFFSGP